MLRSPSSDSTPSRDPTRRAYPATSVSPFNPRASFVESTSSPPCPSRPLTPARVLSNPPLPSPHQRRPRTPSHLLHHPSLASTMQNRRRSACAIIAPALSPPHLPTSPRCLAHPANAHHLAKAPLRASVLAEAPFLVVRWLSASAFENAIMAPAGDLMLPWAPTAFAPPSRT
ncbi:hypothetical protein HYPSUDRAFT_198049 [Hypholoma sublateritium FD-334 SS-4]|uniref:Uncharacterized protein n=1 Tax=Hypholoma sublateritium (strain FD-334 SS-4) TaxID=945553 RepID=A0A0D2PFF6_HYPSF|nr:hypothetical protein HYPSUDRAFT_198049 [Hypholoma sublateritium FD-334 SS-4]